MLANKPVVQLGKLEVASPARARRPIGLGPQSVGPGRVRGLVCRAWSGF